MTEPELDVELISYVCQIFPDFNINRDLLVNWQVELIDNLDDTSLLTAIIEEEVVVGNLFGEKLSITQDDVKGLFVRFNDLDDSVYRDLKVIVFELVTVILTMSYSNRIHCIQSQVYKVIIDEFLTIPIELDDLHKPLLLQQKIRLLTSLMELGCDTTSFQKLMYTAMKTGDIPRKLVLLYFLNRVFSSYPCHFKSILYSDPASKPIALPLVTNHNYKTFSFQSWFKIYHDDVDSSDVPVFTFFKICNSSNGNSISLTVQLINYNQFLIRILNDSNRSIMQFSFNQILNPSDAKNQGYTHFVLNLDKYSNFNLFIDGDYSESIPCPDLGKDINNWDKLYFGDVDDSTIHKPRDELVLRNFTILSTPLSTQWINLLYNLGLGYDWNFKEFSNDNVFSLLNHLSFEGLANASCKLKEITGNRRRRNSFRESLSSFHILKSTLTNQLRSNKHLANGLVMKNFVDKDLIANSLISSKFKESDILFHIEENHFLQNSRSTVYVHTLEPIHGALYITGGTPMLLGLIESIIRSSTFLKSDRDTLLLQSLTLLFNVLKNDWRLYKEFDNINGYGITCILLTNYKLFNKSLRLTIRDEFNNYEPCTSDLWSLILKHCGYDLDHSSESIINNPNCYRFLILGVDLFNDSNFLLLYLRQVNVFMLESKNSEFNASELTKMKFPKKFLHLLKNPSLLNMEITTELEEQFSLTLGSILRTDGSVEIIRSIAHFVISSFYTNLGECNPDFGVIALKVLAEIVCDNDSTMKILKKFSRSITIHWILLLMDVTSARNCPSRSKDVVVCGIKLLSRLLGILGPNIIKKFFDVNRGLDILTHFLKPWWSNDEILCQLYLSAFGLDFRNIEGLSSLNQVVPLNEAEGDSSFSKLLIPDFLNLLNNLVLNSVYTLSEKKGKVLSAPNSPSTKHGTTDLSLDAIHLISLYSLSIEKGYNHIKPLKTFYIERDWLNGIFELVGYLRLFLTWEKSDLLQNFLNCYNRLTKIITHIFISKLYESSNFFEIVNRTNDFTKKLILDIVFPRIFRHTTEFINLSKFIFNEKEFMQNSMRLLLYYNSEYINQNFLVRKSDLTSYLLCVLSVLEANGGTNSPVLRQLRQSLGRIIMLMLLRLSDKEVDPDSIEDTSNDTERFNQVITMILERQIIIFNPENLSDEDASTIIVLIMGLFFELNGSEGLKVDHVFNLLRTVQMMRQSSFEGLVHFMVKDVDYSACFNIICEFFQTLLEKNDDETMKLLIRYPTYRHIFNQKYYSLLTIMKQTSKLNILNMISITLNNGGTMGQLDNIYIKSFERDCINLKNQLLTSEMIKYNRANQDHKENVNYFATNYNSLKIETERLLHKGARFSNSLDFIENSDRMRRRMVIEDQLSDSEKLAYKINIPVKSVQLIPQSGSERSLDVYNTAIESKGINTLSLSSDAMFLDMLEEPFELIDDTQDQENEVEKESYEDKNRKVLRSLFLGDHIVALWNISQINGLAPIESLMILGSTHLYIIENYFHHDDGNVIDVAEAPLELRDPYLQLINSQSTYFQNNSSKSHRTKHWSLETLSSISKRQFLLRDIALEMFFTDGASILLTCLSSKDRDSIYGKLYHFCAGKGLDQDLSQTLQLSSNLTLNNSHNESSFASKIASAFSSGTPDNLLHATKKWRNGEMSNFYYLMIINTLAGRTFNDLTQYPVFPWVIADYTSETLDLFDPKTFRDLSKPMGAQTEPRASQFKERYDALLSLEDENSPAFHYGTHYSSAMIVTSFLIRLRPYVHSYLLLQGGKFDHADRLFNSIEKAWTSASKDNTTDVRELIPEFFYLSEFLVNDNDFEFGTQQNGDTPNNVILPRWAHGDPKLFIQKNREALESPYVSARLHLWIDLIFGYKQSGNDAVKALNVFHHLSYNGAINLDNINDEMERKAVIGTINNFGQTPNKIFSKPHVKREVLNLPNFYFTNIDDSHSPKLIFESKLKCPLKKIEISSKSGKWVGRPACVCTEDDLLIRKAGDIEKETGSLMINNTLFLDLHASNITCISQIGYKKFLTASQDGLINVWKCNTEPNLNLQFLGVLRGHSKMIKELKYSKSFKVGISCDIDGNVILWDLVRFKYIRTLSTGNTHGETLIDISNDTGNIVIVNGAQVKILTLNGDLVLETDLQIDLQKVTNVRFASINDARVETGKPMVINHNYWSEEMISFAISGPQKRIEMYSVKWQDKWHLHKISSLSVSQHGIGDITCHEVLKKSIIDLEDKLSRGYLSIIIGDSTGRVFQW